MLVIEILNQKEKRSRLSYITITIAVNAVGMEISMASTNIE